VIAEKIERISCLVLALAGTTAEKDRIEADRMHLEEVCIQVNARTHQAPRVWWTLLELASIYIRSP
jgi:hypothetical protein